MGGELQSDVVMWEIFQSIIALLAVEEWVTPYDMGSVAPTHVSWLLTS